MHQVTIDESMSRIKENMAKVKHKIIVMSNKGGVGKSSVALAFASALSSKGFKTGLLDIDIHGPSIAKMTGKEGVLPVSDGKALEPVRVKENLVMLSMGSLIRRGGTPVIWRGPMKLNVLKQFLADVRWGVLDYLIIDAPPGTGDEPLSICQLLPGLAGGVVVTTGQEVALLDSVKAVNFLRQLGVRVLGILENMAEFPCPHCGGKIDLFKAGGGEKAAETLGVEFLGRVPFDPGLLEAGDKGRLFMDTKKDSPAARALAAAAEKAVKGLEEK
ncbi:MAG: ATP-binding protein [Elusimicrobia bacterium GWA2_56_46]|nr:MAG: ATP-binding protein [Elusimicrobia bacterium GWA2_56_46]OGR54105.1 MAG: ATP-binding protein [Elusimicrobia bacterium GWC2_56_31]HBW22950.1 ATP-binding protein [Elusimicrobiota bacterium]